MRRMACARIGACFRVLASELRGLRLVYDHMYPLKTGVGVAQWTWKRRERQISVEVFVCGDTAGARKRLVEIATDTTTVESQMVPALEKVGELAMEHKARSRRRSPWVYRNVCVSVGTIRKRSQGLAGRAPHSVIPRGSHSFPTSRLTYRGSRASISCRVRFTAETPSRSGFDFPSGVDPKKLTIDVRPGAWPPLEPLDQEGSDVHGQGAQGGSRRARNHRARSGVATFRQGRRRHRRSPCSMNLGGRRRSFHFREDRQRHLRLVS